MLLPLLLAGGGLAAEPCYGDQGESRIETPHFQVGWDGDRLSEADATEIGGWAEEARALFVDDMGWAITDETIAYVARANPLGEGTRGLTQTVECGGVPVPRIEIFLNAYDRPGMDNLTAHELGHALEYAYMGSYLDSTQSWLWWMEGTATWLGFVFDGDEVEWGRRARNYLDQPWLALHQPQTALLDPERGPFMYGTTALVRFLAQREGEDAVRQTWAWAGERSGEPVSLPEALEGIGVDPTDFWREWMARVPTLDLEGDLDLRGGAVTLERVGSLPTSGEAPEAQRPQGHGFGIVRFEGDTLADGDGALQVRVELERGVDWEVVLVRTAPGRRGRVRDYVPLDVANGRAEGWVSGFGPDHEAYLVASPQDLTQTPRAMSWEAELIKDPGPMDGVISVQEPDGVAKSCGGCRTTGGASAWWLVGLVALVRRRR